MKILLVEDDDEFAELLQHVFSERNYLVERASAGKVGYEMAMIFEYDLILLDWTLPGLDGVQVCQRLRARGDRTPIILMTGRDASTDKIAGLDAGADDYLVKPFELDVLLARMRALLRRTSGSASPILQWRDLQLDLNRAEVNYCGEMLSLTPKEYTLLTLFLRHPHRIFSADVLLERLWSLETLPNSGAVRTHITGLRRKLREAGLTDIIETVYGLGYRLEADIKSSEG